MKTLTHLLKVRGFTVVELMIVVAIAAILATVAAPNFAEFMNQQRVRNAATDLVMDLSLARSEAVKRGANVTVSPVGSWAEGWEVKAGADVISKRASTAGTLSISGSDATFNPQGRALASVSYELTAYGLEGDSNRCVTLAASGSASVKKGGC